MNWAPAMIAVVVAIGVVAIGARCRPGAPVRRRTAGPVSTATSSGGPPARHRAARSGHEGRAGVTIDLLDHVARGLRSGSSLSAAVESAVAAHPCVEPTGRLLRNGSTLHDALMVASTNVQDREERFAVQALLACCHSGGRLAETVERGAGVLRERRTWRHERLAQSAQARLSALVMTLLPAGFAMWGAASDARVRAAYTSSSIAAACAAIGLALNGAGWWWMRRLVSKRIG